MMRQRHSTFDLQGGSPLCSTNDGDGLSWSDRNDYCVEADGCVFSLGTIYWWYVMCFVLYMTGALYSRRAWQGRLSQRMPLAQRRHTFV